MSVNYPLRISKLRKQLSESSFDAILISSVQNCRYLSGFENTDANVAFLIISQQSLFLVTDYRYSQQARQECPHFEVIQRDRAKVSLGQQFRQILTQNIHTLAFEREHISYGLLQDVQSELTGIQFSGISGWVEQQRILKDQYEIDCIKAAAKMADQALSGLIGFMHAGMSERDASLELEYQMQKAGSQGLSFPTILISGERTSLPHGMPSDKKLNPGDLVTIDFGAVVHGYRSDMTRPLVVGEPNKKQLAVYDCVKQAQKAGIDSVLAGIEGSLPYFASKSVLDKSEFAAFQGEGLGHGVGLYLHEQPFLQASCDIVLAENMVITIEPGIYIPSWGGIRIEDDLRVTATGYELLTHSPRDLIII